jgi:hypothetical protein
MAQTYWLRDDLEQAVSWADRALDAAERIDLVSAVVDGLIIKGGALGYLGRGYEGVSTMQGALALAEAHGLTLGALRAQANISDAQIARDPQAAVETARAGLVETRRLGRTDYLGVLVMNGAYGAFRTGEWDWAVSQVADLETAALEDADRVSASAMAVMIGAARGESVVERLAEIERVVNAGSDRQARAVFLDIGANTAFAQGRFAEALDGSLEVAGMMAWLAPTSYLTAARCGLWTRDAGRARDALERLEAITHGPAITAGRTEIAAGLLALDGNVAAAAGRYRDALQAWRDLGLGWDAALTAIDMALLLGPEDSDVKVAAAAAADTLTRLRATPFLDRLAAAMGWATASKPGTGQTGDRALAPSPVAPAQSSDQPTSTVTPAT